MNNVDNHNADMFFVQCYFNLKEHFLAIPVSIDHWNYSAKNNIQWGTIEKYILSYESY